MLTPRLEEKGLCDRIIQGWLISAHIDVDEQDRPLPKAEEPQREAEEASAKVKEASVEPSTTILEKLANRVVF